MEQRRKPGSASSSAASVCTTFQGRKRRYSDDWRPPGFSRQMLRNLFLVVVLPVLVFVGIVLSNAYHRAGGVGKGQSLTVVVPEVDKAVAQLTMHGVGAQSAEARSNPSSQDREHRRTLPPEGKMNVLLLVPDGTTDLPELPSYNWVVVHEASLPKDSWSHATRRLHRSFVEAQPVLVVSTGSRARWEELGVASMPFNFRRLWCHVDDPAQLTEQGLTATFLERGGASDLNTAMPLVSVITSTFRSGDKLWRAYDSLKAQTYDHWEWVLWDDSPEEDTYRMLQDLAASDMRLRVFKAPYRSGYIGEMKLRAGALALGQWILELDHDDRMPAELLEWVRDIAVRHPATKFIYSDGIELGEEGDEPFSYGDYYGHYHASYYRQHLHTHDQGPLRPHFVSRSAWLTPLTVQHLVGLPNHVRIWSKALYDEVGGHRRDLNVADDYDLLVRTFLAARPGEIVCIAAAGYFQYRNVGGNNFTFKRNALIQHLVQYLHEKYEPQLVDKFRALGWPADYPWPAAGLWERPDIPDVAPRMERYYVPDDQDADMPCVSIVVPTSPTKGGGTRADVLHGIVSGVVQQSYPNWKLYLIGSADPDLDRFAVDDLPSAFGDFLDKIYWYNLQRPDEDQGQTAIAYATRMIVKTRWYMVWDGAGGKQQWDNASFLEQEVRGCAMRGPGCVLQPGQVWDEY